MRAGVQVPDDLPLLDLMLEDNRSADDLYQPTNYWARYERKLLPALYNTGLHDFRRSETGVFTSMGATDLPPKPAKIDLTNSRAFSNRITAKLPFWRGLLRVQNSLMNSMLPITGPDNLTEQDLGRLYYAFAATYGHRAGAKAIDGFQASLAGNPQHVILVNGKVYTMRMLAHYMHYAYCCRFIDFDAVQTIVELGSGCGKQAEVK